jgi:hypothetical protein
VRDSGTYPITVTATAPSTARRLITGTSIGLASAVKKACALTGLRP